MRGDYRSEARPRTGSATLLTGIIDIEYNANDQTGPHP